MWLNAHCRALIYCIFVTTLSISLPWRICSLTLTEQKVCCWVWWVVVVVVSVLTSQIVSWCHYNESKKGSGVTEIVAIRNGLFSQINWQACIYSDFPPWVALWTAFTFKYLHIFSNLVNNSLQMVFPNWHRAPHVWSVQPTNTLIPILN